MSITAEQREAIRVAYEYRCGYCGISELDIGGELQIDHYQPITKGGRDNPENLIYACTHCNRFKGNHWAGVDFPDSYQLLYPGEDDLSTHIRVTATGRFEGLTPRGWFHIRRLHLNRPQLVLWRQNQQHQQTLQHTLVQAEITTVRLQQRIQELEREVSVLRAWIRRLSD